jgi:hypothetical protein
MVPPGAKECIRKNGAARGIMINRHVTPRGSMKIVNFFKKGPLKMTITPKSKTSSVIKKILIQNYLSETSPKTSKAFNLRWKLGAQQPIV